MHIISWNAIFSHSIKAHQQQKQTLLKKREQDDNNKKKWKLCNDTTLHECLGIHRTKGVLAF